MMHPWWFGFLRLASAIGLVYPSVCHASIPLCVTRTSWNYHPFLHAGPERTVDIPYGTSSRCVVSRRTANLTYRLPRYTMVASSSDKRQYTAPQARYRQRSTFKPLIVHAAWHTRLSMRKRSGYPCKPKQDATWAPHAVRVT